MSAFSSSRTASWIRRYPRSSSPRASVVCFPPAGASASFYRSWRHLAPQDIDVLTVQYPGRQDRLAEPFLDRIEAMADHIAAEIHGFGDLPLALFGHSMGASIAFEVVVRLERGSKARPVFLGVSARKASHKLEPRGLDCGNDDELIALLEELGGPDSAAVHDPQLRELVLPAIRADFSACEVYRPAAPLMVDVPITFYRGSADPATDADDITYWAELTNGPSVQRVLPGGHFFLLDHEQLIVHDVARNLYTHL